MGNAKLIHSEVLEGECDTHVRIVSNVEGQKDAKVFDMQGQGVMGVVLDQDGESSTGQAFIVGANIPAILHGIETILNMVDHQIKSDPSIQSEMARMALASSLIIMADKIIEGVVK